MKTTVFCGSGAALIDFGGTLTELRAGSLVTDRSAVIAPYEHLLLLPAGSDSEPARRCGDASIKRAARQLLACGNRNLSHDGGNEYDAYGCSREYPDIQILGFSDAGSLARVKFPETVRSIHHGDRSEARSCGVTCRATVRSSFHTARSSPGATERGARRAKL
jgi:hypothetical protein